jgi:hypothetical protein
MRILSTVGEADFCFFLDFQQAADVKCYSKTKVEKRFSLFHVFLCGNEIFNSKNQLIGPNFFLK